MLEFLYPIQFKSATRIECMGCLAKDFLLASYSYARSNLSTHFHLISVHFRVVAPPNVLYSKAMYKERKVSPASLSPKNVGGSGSGKFCRMSGS